MKVLIFMGQFFRLDGSERLAVELAEELNKRGVHTDILTMYSAELSGMAEAREEILKRGVPSVHFLGMKVHPSLWSMVIAIMRLRSLIRSEGYVVIETSVMTPAVIAAWATLGMKARNIVGLHHVFTREGYNNLWHKFWRISLEINSRIRFYAVSKYAKKQWIFYSKTDPGRTHTIPNAIADEYFIAKSEKASLCRELGIPLGGRIVIYIGRLAEYKGIGNLLASLGPILEENNLYLLYAGSLDENVNGSVEIMCSIKNQIVENGWGKRVHFLGQRNDIPRLMASSDLLAHPTLREAFGLVLVEAMAAGLPVVASNVEAIPEVLAGTDSIMVHPDDPDALRAAVLKTLNRHPDETARAIEKGRKRAQDFRMAKRTEEMIQFFGDFIQGHF